MGVYSNNPDYWKNKTTRSYSTGRGSASVELSGFTENLEAFGRIMTNDPQMASIFRKYIKDLLKDVRKKLSQDAKNYMKDDPRKAARAVKYFVYKEGFGGNVSILQKKAGKAGAKYMLVRQRKIDQNPHQRGGNRRPKIDDERNRLEYYFGTDRNYILRFLGSGTVKRMSRFGNRGSIRRTDWFGHTAPRHMEDAANQVAEAINEYVKQQANG